MSSRAARARARAGTAASVPARANPPQQPGTGGLGGVRNNPPQQVMSNMEKYQDDRQFTDLLRRIGVTNACIAQLTNDDFDTMETVVQQYKGNIKSFETYLKTVNKTMHNATNPVRFSPVVMDRLLAVIHYLIQSVQCFHKLPDMALIDRQMAGNLMEPFRIYKQFRTEDADEEVLISLPDLKGHENWITYRDKFLSNLDNTAGSNGTPLLYIVDQTPRAVSRANQPLIDTPTVDLDSWDTYSQDMVHFGIHYKKDNSKVWQLLKKSLLGTQPYHHIDHCAGNENGRRAWESLRSYYEGEDYVNKTIQECLTRVRTMYYRGETPRFNFEKFIDKQKECYKRLRDVGYNNGLGVDDASKCSNLKQMILPDAQLETALSMARTQGLFNGMFDSLIHFLKAEVDELTLRRSQLRANRSQRISAVGNSPNNNNRNNRGRGGRGGRRNGRQGQRINRNRPHLTRFVDGRQIHSGNYSPDEYRRLTPSQREAVKALRQQARQQDNQSRTPDRRAVVSGVTIAAEEPSNNSGQSNQSARTTTTSGVSSITAPSGGVGSYLGNRRGSRDMPPQE